MSENEQAIQEFSKLTKEQQREYLKKQEQERNEKVAMYEEKALDACLNDIDALVGYLKVAGRFERLSVPNTLLIYAQKPDATVLMTFDGWKKHRVNIKKDSEGILLRKRVSTGTYMSGGEVKEGYAFKPYYVFDVTQTDCRPEPEQKIPIPILCKAFDELVSDTFEAEPVEADSDGSNLSMMIYSYEYTLLTNNKSEDANFKACLATISICSASHITAHKDIFTALELELNRFRDAKKPLKNALIESKVMSGTFEEKLLVSIKKVLESM